MTRVSVECIKRVIVRRCGLDREDMTSQCRLRRVARPRQVAMYFVRKLTTVSLPKAGALFGGRDHTTCLHSVKAVTARAKRSPVYQTELDDIERMIFEEAAISVEARGEERRAKWMLAVASFVHCKASCEAVRAHVPRAAPRFYVPPQMPVGVSGIAPVERARLMGGRA